MLGLQLLVLLLRHCCCSSSCSCFCSWFFLLLLLRDRLLMLLLLLGYFFHCYCSCGIEVPGSPVVLMQQVLNFFCWLHWSAALFEFDNSGRECLRDVGFEVGLQFIHPPHAGSNSISNLFAFMIDSSDVLHKLPMIIVHCLHNLVDLCVDRCNLFVSI